MSDTLDLGSVLRCLRSGINQQENARVLFERFYPLVLSFFKKRGYDLETQRDLTQIVFTKVFTSIKDLKHERAFRSWLQMIMNNVHQNYLQHLGRDKRDGVEVQYEDLPPPIGDGGRDTGLMRVLREERALLLKQEVAQLPEKIKRCVVLRLNEDLTDREIALRLGIPVGTAKSRLAEARKRLGVRLARHFRNFEESFG